MKNKFMLFILAAAALILMAAVLFILAGYRSGRGHHPVFAGSAGVFACRRGL
jgi:hypothetical protein